MNLFKLLPLRITGKPFVTEIAIEKLPIKEYAKMLWNSITDRDVLSQWDLNDMIKEYSLSDDEVNSIIQEINNMKQTLDSISNVNISERIEKQDSSYVVKPSKGDKVLGTHKTKKAALKQLAAIEISKAKRK